MSAAPSGTARTASRPAQRPAPATAGRDASVALSLVPQQRSTPARAPFVTMVVVLLAGGLLGLLALNTVLAQDAFRLHALVKENKALVDREQTLEREVETLRTPRNLAERARELGMVQGSTPAFLRLPDGAVLGAEVPAEGDPMPEPVAQQAPDAGAPEPAASPDEQTPEAAAP